MGTIFELCELKQEVSELKAEVKDLRTILEEIRDTVKQSSLQGAHLNEQINRVKLNTAW